jgi:Zn-dependent M28 family amino/carboxypeptidase
MRLKRASSLFATTFTLMAGCAGTAVDTAEVSRPSFSEQAYRAHIERLSSDEFEGRAPGTRGEEKTLAYLEAAYREAGLQPAIGSSYLQPVPMVEIASRPDDFMTVQGAGQSIQLPYGESVVYWTKRPVAESRISDAELVFAGYGIVAPEYGWNDYAGVDMRGKIAVVLVNDPGFATQDPDLFTGNAMTYYGRWTYKFEEAVRQGAAGLFVVHETKAASYPWEVVRNGAARPQFDLLVEDYEKSRLAIEGWMTQDTAEQLLAAAGESYSVLKRAALDPKTFRARPLGLKASVGVRNLVRTRKSYNVVGVLPGSERPDEYFLYTAHWDHLGRIPTVGRTDADTVFNGAIDNATGTAALLELARVFGATRPRPERSLMFVAFTLEESGLLGSQYFAENPPVPVAKMVGGINMDGLDMLGRTGSVSVVGYDASELDDFLRQAVAAQNRTAEPEPTPESGRYYRSDHFNLAKVGVPMLYFKSGIDHIEHGSDFGRAWQEDYYANRYHKPSDEYSPSWDVSGVLQDLDLYYGVGLAVANSEAWPNWRPGGEFRAIRDESRAALR